MRRSMLGIAAILAALLSLAVAAPAGAATTGTVCGRVSAYTPPTLTADGNLTINGQAETIAASAVTAIDATAQAALAAQVGTGATVCLNITANEAGAIVDIALAGSARLCGDVDFNAAANAYSVDGVLIPATVVNADAELAALLELAATANGDACVDLGVDTTTGLIVTAGATANLRLCGDVIAEADGDAVVNGAVIPAELLRAGAAALLQLAAAADGTACVDVTASHSNGNTTVGVAVTVEVCATVTAISDGTITLNGVTFTWGGAADGEVRIGDRACITAGTGPTGAPVITGGEGVFAGAFNRGAGAGGPSLPDTALTSEAIPGLSLIGGVLVAIGLGLVARRRTLSMR